MDTKIVSFPGLGIGEFELDPTAFKIFGFEIQWYGLIITVGIILAVVYCSLRAKQEGIKFDHVLDIAIFTVIFGVIGARLGYVLFSLDQYHSFLDVINIRNGGLQIYGGIVAGAATIIGVCKYKKIKPLKMLDAVAPGVMIGQFVGRWGNFMNGEAHGGYVKEGSPLYFLRMELDPHWMNGDLQRFSAAVHPTFLYESLWNVIGFVIINLLYKKKKFDGQILLMYLSWYGFGRMFIEMLRTDSLYIGKSNIRISSLIGFLCFAAGTTLLIIFLVKAKKKKAVAEGEAYTPAYPRLSSFGKTASTEAGEAPVDKSEAEQSLEDKMAEELKSADAESASEDAADEESTESVKEETQNEDAASDDGINVERSEDNKEDIEKRFTDIFSDNNEEK